MLQSPSSSRQAKPARCFARRPAGSIGRRRPLSSALLAMAPAALALVVVALCLPGASQAQTLLERLEQRVRGALQGSAEEPAAVAADATPPAAGPLAEQPAAQDRPGPLPLGMQLLEIANGEGVYVDSVEPESAAAAAGLASGDVIRAAAGQPVRDLAGFQRIAVGQAGPVDIQFERQGTLRRARLTFPGEPPLELNAARRQPGLQDQDAGDPLPEPPAANIFPDRPAVRPSLGVTVAAITPALERQYRLATGEGILITSITPGSPAARAGLPLGGVLVSAEGVPLREPQDLVGVIQAARLDRPLELAYYDGNQLFRKSVLLVPVLDTPPAFPPEPAAPLPAPGGIPETGPERFPQRGPERPALRRLERALDSLIGPEAAPQPATAPPPADLALEVEVLRAQVRDLQQQLLQLQQRVRRLEDSGGNGSGGNGSGG